jgi:iron(III) transport system substrate-binding protein
MGAMREPIVESYLSSLARWVFGLALSSTAATAAFAQGEVNVVCSVAMPWCEAIAAAFLKDTGITVNLTFKDSSEALAQLAAEKDVPKHDVWYAGAGSSHTQAAVIGLTEEYRSPLLPGLRDWAIRQAEESTGHSVGIHAAVLGIAYNSKTLARKRLPEPKCWADIGKPEYHGEVEMPNPISSTAAYAAVATFVQLFGEDRAFELLKAIHRNVSTYPRTSAGPVRAAARGETTIAVTWLHDALSEVANQFPITIVMPCEGTGYEVGSMSIVHGAPHPETARRFYEWALTPAAQRIGGDTKYFEVPANKATAVSSVAPDWSALRLVAFDFVKYGAAAERKRLLEKWDREVHEKPR